MTLLKDSEAVVPLTLEVARASTFYTEADGREYHAYHLRVNGETVVAQFLDPNTDTVSDAVKVLLQNWLGVSPW